MSFIKNLLSMAAPRKPYPEKEIVVMEHRPCKELVIGPPNIIKAKLVPAISISDSWGRTKKYFTAKEAAKRYAFLTVQRLREKRSRELGKEYQNSPYYKQHFRGCIPVPAKNRPDITLMTGQSDMYKRAYRRFLGVFEKYLP